MTRSLSQAFEDQKHRFTYVDINALDGFDAQKTPYCIKVLLENLLRHEPEGFVTPEHLSALTDWKNPQNQGQEIPFSPARVLLQDFTGVPLLVDLALMRDAMHTAGGDPLGINPIKPMELVVDHSIMVDAYV